MTGRSGLAEDRVRTDAAPHDVRLTLDHRFSVLEGRSTIAGPRHLEDALGAFDSLDAKPFAEAARSQVLDELCDGKQEGRLLSGGQGVEV